MLDLQEEKKLVLNYFNDLDNAENDELVEIISKYTSDNFHMRLSLIHI